MSDHFSGPAVMGDPSVDITDFYAFPSPRTPREPRSDHECVSDGDIAVVFQQCSHSPVSAPAADEIERRGCVRNGRTHDRCDVQ